MIAKNELLKKYNISEDEFEVADIKWEELEYIYKDFSEKRSSYEQKLAEFQKEFLMNISENGIHSIRTRVKDAEHLIVKIIRKRQENYKKYRTLDKGFIHLAQGCVDRDDHKWHKVTDQTNHYGKIRIHHCHRGNPQ